MGQTVALTRVLLMVTVGLHEGLTDAALFTAMVLVVLTSALLPMVLLRDLPSDAG